MFQEISVILETHIGPSVTATAVEHIPSGSHAVYKVTDSGGARYILKLGARMWPQKIETEMATLIYFRNYTRIPVPDVRGYRVGNWKTDYILMDFVEGQKLRMLWSDLSKAERISYIKQIASVYAELDRTSFFSIGSLRLGGVVGPLDTLDTITTPDGLVGTISVRMRTLRLSGAANCVTPLSNWLVIHFSRIMQIFARIFIAGWSSGFKGLQIRTLILSSDWNA
jgi:hypothetical protein